MLRRASTTPFWLTHCSDHPSVDVACGIRLNSSQMRLTIVGTQASPIPGLTGAHARSATPRAPKPLVRLDGRTPANNDSGDCLVRVDLLRSAWRDTPALVPP
jgi:hypothetical protein